MRNKLKQFLCKHSALLAMLALTLAATTANATCFYLSYQPDEPASLSKFRK